MGVMNQERLQTIARKTGSMWYYLCSGEDFGGVTFGNRSLQRKGRGMPPPDGLELQPLTRRNLLAETSSPSRSAAASFWPSLRVDAENQNTV